MPNRQVPVQRGTPLLPPGRSHLRTATAAQLRAPVSWPAMEMPPASARGSPETEHPQRDGSPVLEEAATALPPS